MELKPVSNYDEARYPCLNEYYADRNKGLARGLTLAAAMAALAMLLNGCASYS